MNTDLVTKDLTTTSLALAELFGKQPSSVNRTIRNIIKDMSEDEIGLCNIAQSSYLNEQNKEQPMFILGEEMALIVTGRFTGKNALTAQMKLAKAFIAMRDYIKSNQAKLSADDERMLKLTRINPQCLKAITGSRNNNEVGRSYEALELAGIMESVIEWKSFKRWRFTADGLNYCNGYHQGIPRFKDETHNKVMTMIESVKIDNPQLSIF